MPTHRPLALPIRFALAALVAGLVVPAAPAQEVTPVDCPSIVDADGRRVGPVVGLGMHNESNALYTVKEDGTIPIVALAVDGEPFLLGVIEDRLVGTLVREQRVLLESDDCTGTPHARASNYFDSRGGDWQGAGPVPVTAILGPAMTLWVLDRDTPRVPLMPRSSIYFFQQDPRLERCGGVSVPTTLMAHPMRRVADLADFFTPPFRLDAGPCPRPGPGRP